MKNFLDDLNGNVAISFVLVLFVILGMAGGAVDYTRVTSAKSGFQEAADSAALAAAIEYKKKPWESAKAYGLKFLGNHSPESDLIEVIGTDLKFVDDQVIASVKARSKNTILSAVGYDSFKIEVESIVSLPDYPIEVALVLDNTFSMSVQGKISTLKNTADEFVDTLLNQNLEHVKISIVPFAQYVNVGTDKLGSNWLEASDQEVVIPRQCSKKRDVISQSGCTSTTTNHPAQNVPEQCTPARYNDGVEVSPAICTPAHTKPAYTTTTSTCANTEYGPEYEQCIPEQRYTINWNGCVASRANPFNTNDKNYSKKVPGPNSLVCPSPITPLTNDKTELKKSINTMIAVGDTYIPQGVVWGYRTLTKAEPFGQAISDAERKEKGGKRYIILMTDGMNSRSPVYKKNVIKSDPNLDVGLHYGSDTDESDDYLIDTCKNAKKDEIEIYTVSFGKDVDSDTKNLLEECATSKDHFFDAESNSELISTFQVIADSIVTVFLAK